MSTTIPFKGQRQIIRTMTRIDNSIKGLKFVDKNLPDYYLLKKYQKINKLVKEIETLMVDAGIVIDVLADQNK